MFALKQTADSTEETHELKQPPEILYNLIKVASRLLGVLNYNLFSPELKYAVLLSLEMAGGGVSQC